MIRFLTFIIVLTIVFLLIAGNVTIDLSGNRNKGYPVDRNTKDGFKYYCTRTEKYENPAKYAQALSLIEIRLKDWYGNEGIAKKLIPIIPCIVVNEGNVREKLDGAEGYFAFADDLVRPNFLPIYVDKSYRYEESLVTAFLVIHEMTHAWQYLELLNGNTYTCYDQEVMAFLAQFDFLRTLTLQELEVIQNEIMYDPSPHRQIQYSQFLMDLTSEANELCKGHIRRDNSWVECILTVVASRVKSNVLSNPAYQKQCSDRT